MSSLKLIAQIASVLLIIAGLFHIAMTDENYDTGSTEALWFMGSGLMLIASGLFSFTAIRSCERDGLIGAGIVNLAGLILSLMAIQTIAAGHTYLLLVLYVLCLIGVIYRLIPRQS